MKEINNLLKNQIYFVIPAYNEGPAIKKVLLELHKNGYKNIVVIDDGSKDNTFEEAINTNIKNLVVLEHSINRGQGASLKTGIDYCLRNKECKYIVTFDSDGQHRISDLINFIDPLEKEECDIAMGSRFLSNKTKKLVPLKKRILLKGALFITWILSNKWFTDTHNGYRVMNRKAAKLIDISMDRFEHASEILDEVAKKRILYKEVPVYIDYTDYSKQKGQKMSNSIKILTKMVFK